MIELDQARELLGESAEPLVAATLPLADALGCRIARPPVSDVDLPPTDVSAMDGYAVRAGDLERREPLPVAFTVAAGTQPGELPPASAARIFTGAPVPVGADTVIAQEQAAVHDDGRVLLETAPKGRHVRHRGEVIAAGDELAPIGARVTPAMVSLLASCGAARLEVIPKPRLAVVITGAELVDASATPGPGQIRDSNGPLLAALAAASGLGAVFITRAGDSVEALENAISSALDEADLVVTTGGVSVGDFDLVPDVVRSLGGKVVFHRVRVKPGKPVLAADIGRRWLVGLPGNPLAVLAGWRLFAWPLAETLAGNRRAFAEAPLEVELAASAPSPKSRTELRPALMTKHDGRTRATVLDWKGSHDVRSAAAAEGLLRLEPGRSYQAGSTAPWYGLPSGCPFGDPDKDMNHEL